MWKSFRITHYEVALSGLDRPAVIRCYGAHRLENLWIVFWTDETNVQQNKTWPFDDPQEIQGTINLLASQVPYAWFLDLLRNEEPVFAYVDTDPEQNHISSGAEPVGDGDWI